MLLLLWHLWEQEGSRCCPVAPAMTVREDRICPVLRTTNNLDMSHLFKGVVWGIDL